MNFNNVKIGDTLFVEGWTSFATDSTKTVTNIETKYDTDTGVPYNVICCGSHKFDARDGDAMTSPTWYYIGGVK